MDTFIDDCVIAVLFPEESDELNDVEVPEKIDTVVDIDVESILHQVHDIVCAVEDEGVYTTYDGYANLSHEGKTAAEEIKKVLFEDVPQLKECEQDCMIAIECWLLNYLEEH
jgi:hypothetical protein